MSIRDHSVFLRDLKSRGFVFDCIYDVGANIGNWSKEAAKIFPNARFELFEPLAGRYRDVDDRSVAATISGATLHSVALADINSMGEIKILDKNGAGSSILVLESDRAKDIPIMSCEYCRLDDFILENNLPQPEFIKLDTQASELKVLKGGEMTLMHTQFILTETWTRRVYGPETPLFQELSDWLYDHDFVLYELLSLEDGRDSDGTLRWFDAVFVNKRFRTSVGNFPGWMF